MVFPSQSMKPVGRSAADPPGSAHSRITTLVFGTKSEFGPTVTDTVWPVWYWPPDAAGEMVTEAVPVAPAGPAVPSSRAAGPRHQAHGQQDGPEGVQRGSGEGPGHDAVPSPVPLTVKGAENTFGLLRSVWFWLAISTHGLCALHTGTPVLVSPSAGWAAGRWCSPTRRSFRPVSPLTVSPWMVLPSQSM